MALIICPECGGQVSDKATTCPHCGYPLKGSTGVSESKGYELILKPGGHRYTAMRVLKYYLNISTSEAYTIFDTVPHGGMVLMQCLPEDKEHMDKFKNALTNAGCPVSINEISGDKAAGIKEKNTVHCPRCGSTQITTGQRGYSIFWGPIGSGKTVNRCAKCGYQWEP